jgi:DNA-binding NtrC family response regulator
MIGPLDLVWPEISSPVSLSNGPSASVRLDDIEREHIRRTLAMLNWHKVKAAEALGIDRKTLRNKMRRYKLS